MNVGWRADWRRRGEMLVRIFWCQWDHSNRQGLVFGQYWTDHFIRLTIALVSGLAGGSLCVWSVRQSPGLSCVPPVPVGLPAVTLTSGCVAHSLNFWTNTTDIDGTSPVPLWTVAITFFYFYCWLSLLFSLCHWCITVMIILYTAKMKKHVVGSGGEH